MTVRAGEGKKGYLTGVPGGLAARAHNDEVEKRQFGRVAERDYSGIVCECPDGGLADSKINGGMCARCFKKPLRLIEAEARARVMRRVGGLRTMVKG